MSLARFRGCFKSPTASECRHPRCESARMGVWWCERSHRLNSRGQCGICDDYVVTKGVTMPKRRSRVRNYRAFPFAEMEVGDSFAFPYASQALVHSAASGFGRRHGREFALRGARVWRTA